MDLDILVVSVFLLQLQVLIYTLESCNPSIKKLYYCRTIPNHEGKNLPRPATLATASYASVRSGGHNHNKMLIKSTGSHLLLHRDEYIMWLLFGCMSE